VPGDGGARPRVRLRQAVIVAAELEPVAAALREALGLGEPFRDPGVAEFGLHNAVFAIGDCFIEVISPTQPGTAAGRYLERHGGDGGYMTIFDLDDLDGARARAAKAGVRVVWQIDLPDISGTHLHPADMRGAIVSLDESRPYGSWRWGGPKWTGQVADHGAPGTLVETTVAVDDPASVAKRWGHVLGASLAEGPQPVLTLDGGEIGFAAAADGHAEGLTEIGLAAVPSLPSDGVVVGGVLLRSFNSSRRDR
jgi:Glyoxalase-like domain